MKKITEFSVNYPITIAMAVLAVLLLGYISFQKLGMDLFPDINNPRIFVELEAGELPPEEIEQKFVKNIEALSIRQKNVTRVSSVSRVGSAQVTIEYAWDTTMDEAFLDVQKALSNFQQMDDIDEFTISQHDPNATPVILLAFSHPEITDMDELRKVGESYLRNELIRLEGIADVRLLGQEEKEVVVMTESYMLDAYGLTPSELSGKINEYNRNISGGSIVEMGLKYIIKGVGEFSSLDDIRNIIVAYNEAGQEGAQATQTTGFTERVPVFLSDVAEVYFRNKKPDNIVRMDGKRCMGLAIYKEMKFNTVQAVEEFMGALETVDNALPGYELTIIQNQGEFITDAIDEVKQTAIYGIILAIIILFVFLRRIGTTMVISTAIPISIVATFNLMYFNGLTLNIMTLGGLALGAGMLVDNAIVVMENIFRNLETGMSLREAAINGSAEVSGAITASTITTIVVFLPIVYLHSSAGELFKDQAWTVTFSLISSLFVAILVIPMLSSRFLKNLPKKVSATKQSQSFAWYAALLRGILKLRWIVILLSIAIVVGTAYLIPIIGSEFIPKTGLNEFSIEIKLPEGTELFRTSDTVENIEQSIMAIVGDDLKTVFSIIGPSGDITGASSTLFEDENTATIKVVLKDDMVYQPEVVISAINEAIKDITDVEARFVQEQTALQLTLGDEQAPIVIEVQGEDIDTLQQLTDEMKEKSLEIDELYNVETSFDEGRPEIDIVLDRIRAGLYNIGIQAASSQISNRLMGTEAGQMEDAGELKDITIELPHFGKNQLDDIVIKSGGRDVHLYEIADIKTSYAPKEILRNNQARVGKVTAQLMGTMPLDKTVGLIRDKMADVVFPPDYKYLLTGEEQKRQEAFNNLKFALILSLVLVYMVLASQFESLVHPFTIIVSIPMAVVGAILIFFILGKSLNIMAYIGIIMLVGIAVNDSIILVDAINRLKREGLARTDAIVEAGRRRIRPIIMTSLTTIMALLPLTIGFGEGASLRAPMALAVIGGLVTSTLLTLVVIPCVYSVFDAVNRD